MATFNGTTQEFKRYLGPRLRNVVLQITRRHRAEVGACEHCGVGDNLESAHVHGRDRTEIIDLLIGTAVPGDAVHVDLVQFEKAFRFEHEPVEKAILILCRDCHRKYDAQNVGLPAVSQADPRMPIPAVSPARRAVREDILPITLEPPHVGDFKDLLLKRKAAEFRIFYSDGRTETRPWNAFRFSPASSVFGNLRSRPEFRQGEWQSRGIVKVHVRVVVDA